MNFSINISNRPVTIAIIDSGIDTSTSDLSKYVKKSTGFSINNEGFIVEDESLKVRSLHGTIIALIIKQLCENIDFINFNILNEELVADGRVLIYALNQALLYKPDIIHLSLGTTRWRYKLALNKIVKQALKNNIIIVSAADNSGLKSFPAYLKGVIGVKSGKMSDCNDFEYSKNFFYAPCGIDGIHSINELSINKNASGTSMSAAYITGHIASIKHSKNLSNPKEIINHLKYLAINKIGG